MSGGIAPSKSTAYVSNLPFSLTNNDLHKIFEKYGKVVKVTIMRDKETHKSRGVAFILFLERDSAHQCVRALNNTQMFGRTIKCKIATDNGRASDYIRRKVYKDKSRCYECGEEGHLSYKCPHNLFGDREPPEKKKKKRKGRGEDEENEEDYDEDDDDYEPVKRKPRVQQSVREGEEMEEEEEGEDPAQESLATAISYQQIKHDEDDYRYRVATGDYPATSAGEGAAKKKFKKDAYFSDEEEIDDD